MPSAYGRVLWPALPMRGKLQYPGALNVEAGRVNSYIYTQNSTLTITMTTQGTWYLVTFSQAVPSNFQSNVTNFTPAGGCTVLQAGWGCPYYCCPVTGLDSAQTYQTGIFVNGNLINSGLDTISNVSSYTFGGGFSGPPSAGINSIPYYNFSANDTVELKMRCTTANSKTASIAAQAADLNTMSFQFDAYPWNARLADQNCGVETVPPGRIYVPQTDDYVVSWNSGASNSTGNGYDFARVTEDYASKEGRRLYGRSGNIIRILGGSWVDLVCFKQNPNSGDTTPPWTPNSSHNLEVKTARSLGL
jgi:hypothetical protein